MEHSTPAEIPGQTTSSSAASNRNFHEVHVHTLRVDTTLPFSLYTKIEGEHLVYRRENLPFTVEQHEALEENGVEILYVSADHLGALWDYLQGNVQSIVADTSVPLDTRASLFYHSSVELTKQALATPIRPENVASACTVVESSLGLLREGKSALHSLMKQMEGSPDLYTSSLNNCQYGLALARELGIVEATELEAFGLGLIFMDIGLLQVPTQLIWRDGPPSFDEWIVIKRHPAAALELLSSFANLPELCRVVVIGHEERLDGSGYPQGLKGAELNLAVRIAGLVATFNELTTHPDSMQRLTTFQAIKTLKTNMRGQFCPDVLERFVELLGIEVAAPVPQPTP